MLKLGMFWSLVRLRYQLLWAESRTSGGRVALFLTVYVLGGLILLFSSLGGFGAAAAGVRMGRGIEIAQVVLGSLFICGVCISVLLGVGPRAAFSDLALRRFPLTPTFRIAARHLVGLLDPFWLLMSASVLGLIFGFAALGSGLIFVGLLGGLLFIITNYLAAVVLLTLIDRLLQVKGGATILSGIVFGLFTVTPLFVFIWEKPYWPPALGDILQFTPPGAAAALIANPVLVSGIFSVAILALWGVTLATIIGALERRVPISLLPASTKISWGSIYDQLAGGFGREYAPHVGKALRYHLRCNRVRFNLAVTAPMIAFLGKLMGMADPQEVFFITLALFFLAGFGATNAMALNQFGYDGAGVRRYLMLSGAFVKALYAGSFVSLIFGGAVILTGLALWIQFSGVRIEARIIGMLFGSGVAGLFFFNAMGLWTSVLSPRSVDFGSIVGNHLSFAGNLVMFGGILPAFMVTGALAANSTLATVLRYWWILLLLVIFCIGFYIISMKFVAGVLGNRHERLVETIAGAKAN